MSDGNVVWWNVKVAVPNVLLVKSQIFVFLFLVSSIFIYKTILSHVLQNVIVNLCYITPCNRNATGLNMVLSVGAAEYTDCISAEE